MKNILIFWDQSVQFNGLRCCIYGLGKYIIFYSVPKVSFAPTTSKMAKMFILFLLLFLYILCCIHRNLKMASCCFIASNTVHPCVHNWFIRFLCLRRAHNKIVIEAQQIRRYTYTYIYVLYVGTFIYTNVCQCVYTYSYYYPFFLFSPPSPHLSFPIIIYHFFSPWPL